MKGTQLGMALLGVVAFGATLIAPGSAVASTASRQQSSGFEIRVASPAAESSNVQSIRYYRRWHHYRRHPRYYYVNPVRYNTAKAGFPNYYPNIKYFRKDGHIYTRNLDTGAVYLSQW